ncbi:MAG: tannase/feruloyl esterase family alpha/beta hydrolase [Blastocatellia bacterium]|nr:MAG: tannase/feruloyl esterase family alpha/beta hydrolase [Blastocatellia bacterium]
MNRKRLIAAAALVAAGDLSSQSAYAASCESLAMLPVPHATVTLANIVEAGTFVQFPPARGATVAPPVAPPPARGGVSVPAAQGRGGRGNAPPSPFADLPAFCRVTATLMPSPDSDIKMELWLPVEGWNGNLRGTGNGGLGGGVGVNPGALANGLRRGYATAGNNTGHEGDSSYALNHPEKIKDFGWRSTHEMTVAAKALIAAFYGSGPKVAYIAEGGGGTIAALSSAQRYPEDYDMVAVVGMSSHLSRHTAGQMWVWYATHKDAASFIPESKYSVLHDAALAACDAKDGLKDGVIGDPEHCKFDPASIECKGTDGPSCLTAPQVEAARKIYSGPVNPRTGEQIYSPLYPGSELAWGQLAGGAQPLGIPVEFFKYYVFRDPSWDYTTRPVDFDRDIARSDEVVDANAVNPDLRNFFARGGKLLLVDGWNDTAVPPKVAVDYYKRVVATVGAKAVRESMRFFMVPGMNHGPGTNGPENYNFDSLSIIEQWKQTGRASEQLIVSHFKNGMEVGKRLVCQYPQVATYKGSGNSEDPGSYRCR